MSRAGQRAPQKAAAEPPGLAGRAAAATSTALREVVAPVAGTAVASYLLTLVAVGGLSLLLAVACGWLAAARLWQLGLLAAAVTLAAGLVVGLVLAPKRAVTAAVITGVRKTQLGRRLSALVFERLCGVTEESWHGDRGGRAAQAVERLPLAQASKRMRAVVDGLVRDPDGERGLRAWLRRKIRAVALGQIEQLTLARFRQEGQQHGGVNLERVRDEVAAEIDAQLTERLASAGRLTTALLLGALAAGSLALAWLLRIAGG